MQKNKGEIIAMSIFEYNEKEEIRKLRKAEYEAQQITQGVKVEEKTVHKWLNEKKNMKTTY